MDFVEKMASFGCMVTGSLFYLFYKMYSNRMQSSEYIRKAKHVQLKDLRKVLDEMPEKTIEYGTVEGIVDSEFAKLRSHHGTMEGVVQMIQKVEHKSRRVQGYWSDAKRIMQDTVEIVPFKLVEPGKKQEVHILEADSAALLQDELTVTFDHFEPGKSSLLQNGIDRIFGEVTKGFQDTEKMLLVGTNIHAIGRLSYEGGKAVVGPPTNNSKYILTKLSTSAVIRKFESQAFVYKVLTVIFGGLSAGLLIYLVIKFCRRYKEHRRNQAVFEEIRSQSGRQEGENVEQQCVICLASPRNVIIMHCRHVCLCASCAELLPLPRKCPVCRQPVDQFLPLYNS